MRGATWTAVEIELLRLRRSQKVAVPAIAAELGRPVAGTYARARIENILVMERKEWDEAEIGVLIALDDARVPLADMARTLGRTENSVRWKLDDIGRGGKRVAYWDADEEARLRVILDERNDEEIDFEAVAARLADGGPGRTPAAVEARVRELGLLRPKRFTWNAVLVARLKAAVAADSIGAFAAEIGRAEATVRARAVKLGLLESDRTWSAADAAALREEGPVADKALRVGRSERAVIAKMRSLGIPLPERPRVVRAAPVRRVRPPAVVRRAPVRAPAPAGFGRAVPVVQAPVTARSERPAAAPLRGLETARPRAVKATDAKIAAKRQLADMGDAIAAFMADRGVTREQVDPVDQVVRDLRRKGYAVVASGDGWLVDGRHALSSADALMAFARARAIDAPFLMAAE